MVRCADFYEKWKRDPNWCMKSPDTVAQIDHYLELVGELEALGADTIAVYKKLPEGTTAREVLKIKDPEVRKTVIHNAAGMIKRGEKVTSSDVKVWAGIEVKTKKLTSDTDVNDPTIVGNKDPIITDSIPIISPISDTVPPAPIAPVLKEKYNPPHVSESPFITGAQDKDGVIPAPIVPTSAPTTEAEIKKQRLELMEHHARELIKLFSPEIQRIVRETREYRKSYGDKDVIYYALLAFDAVKVNKR